MASTTSSPPKGTKCAVLARAPSASAKTRLAADVGTAAAGRLYRAMLADLFANVAPAHRLVIPYVDGDADAFRAASGWSGPVRGQCLGDLGRRIADAIERCRSDGADGVVVIGSDAPQVDAALLARAAALLRRSEVVVGPAVDGGFYLLGVAAAVEIGPLLDSVEWGSATVTSSLHVNAAHGGLTVESLERLLDLDRAADVYEFLQTPRARSCPSVCEIAATL